MYKKKTDKNDYIKIDVENAILSCNILKIKMS